MATNFWTQPRRAIRTQWPWLPSDVVWRYSLAVVSQVKGDAASAVASLQATLALDPKNVPALLRLAEIRLERGEFPAASALFDKVLAIDPKSAAALAGLGRLALAGKEFRVAVQRLEMALSAEPQAYGPLLSSRNGIPRSRGQRKGT